MLTRMKLAFSHLQHKFRQGFKDTLNPLVTVVWKLKPLFPALPLLYFKLSYHYEWLENITTFFTTISNSNLISFLLFGDGKLDDTMKKKKS